MARRFVVPALGHNPTGAFTLVRGARPFLNAGAHGGQRGNLYHMSDRRQLRALAEAILHALDEYPRDRKKR
jgi:hypothetical protein